MATITFDGTSSQTANQTNDIIIFSANPTAITSISESGGNVVIAVGSNTLTLTGQTLANIDASKFVTSAVSFGDGLPASFDDAATNTLTSTLARSLLGGLGGNDTITVTNASATGSHLVFGGAGFVDTTDGDDTITIGTKGTFAVYANAGTDIVDATSLLTDSKASIFGGNGNDRISVGTITEAVSAALYGGASATNDSILARTASAGSMTVFGGVGSVDAADGVDSISIAGAGSFLVFANGGNDSIFGSDLANGARYSIFGGGGNDSVQLAGAISTTGQIFGGAGGDAISVSGLTSGSTLSVFGGVGSVDSADGADSISVGGTGTFTIFANGGADSVYATFTDSAKFSVFGGAGVDQITSGGGGASLTGQVFGGADGDKIDIVGTGTKQNISIFGGVGSVDAADGADSISIAGAGNFTVYANAGNDDIKGADILDGSNVSIYGGGGNDSVTFGGSNITVAGQVFGGEGGDNIVVSSGGALSIFGGVGATDSSDLADVIKVGGSAATAGVGSFTIYGNAGNDSITVGNVSDVNRATVFGGLGNDVITLSQTTAANVSVAGAIQISGSEGADSIVLADGSQGQSANGFAGIELIGFQTGAGGDLLDLTGNSKGTGVYSLGADALTIAAGVTAAAAGDGGTNAIVKAFQVGADAFVVVDNTDGAFAAATDTVIKLTGVLANSIAPANINAA